MVKVGNLLSNSLTLRQEHVLYSAGGDDSYRPGMDRAPILSYLQAAEELVANGDRLIARHCDFIYTLERAGHDTSSAMARLREMEKADAAPYASAAGAREIISWLDRPAAQGAN